MKLGKINYLKILERESVLKALIVLSVPAIFSLLVGDFYNISNSHYLNVYLGIDSISALSITYNFFLFFIAIGYLFSTGVQILVSIKIGEKSYEVAKKTAGTAISFVAGVGIVFMILGLLKTDVFLGVFATPKTLYPFVKSYMQGTFMTLPFILVYFTLFGIFFGIGRIKLTLYISLLFCLANVIGVPLLLAHGYKMGSVAFVNGTASFVLDFVMLYMLRHTVLKFRLKWRHFKVDFQILKQIIYIGSGYCIPFFTKIIAMNVVIHIINDLGDNTVLAIWGTALRIYMFAYMIMIGLRQAASPIFSYNLGAKNFNRVKETYKVASQLAVTLGGIAIIIGVLFYKAIIDFQISTAMPIHYVAFLVIIFALPFSGIEALSFGFLQSVKKIKTALLLDVIDKLLLIVLAIALTRFFGINAIYFLLSITSVIMSGVLYITVKNQVKSIKKWG